MLTALPHPLFLGLGGEGVRRFLLSFLCYFLGALEFSAARGSYNKPPVD